MPKCHLSQEFSLSLSKTIPNKTIHYIDKELSGFILEHRTSGAGTWYFRYKNRIGKTKYYRIGSMDSINALLAREQAYHVFTIVRDGGDPHLEIPLRLKDLTIKQFIYEQYLPHIQLKKRSWRLDERILKKYFLPVFTERALSSIKEIEIIVWQNSLPQQKLQASSCNRIISVIKSVFNCAVRWGSLDILHNPCKVLTPFPENLPQTRYLNPKEAQQLIIELKNMGNNKSALALQLLLFTGARKHEILSARWENVYFEERILTVPLSKSGKVRHIPLSDEALKLIQSLPRHKESYWLFPSKNEAKHISSLYRVWDKVRQKLYLQNMRIHDLRHSFASLLVNDGCSLYEVQKILGHRDPRVTMRYAHLTQKSLVEAANRVGKSINISREEL